MHMAVSITAVEQNSYPSRVLVSVTGLTLGDRVEIYRIISSERTLIRGGLNESTADTSFLVVDAELPFDLPLNYLALVNGTDSYASGSLTPMLDDARYDVVTDAISGNAAQAIRTAQPEWDYDNNVSVYQVAGRNIVVSNGVGQYTSEIEFFTAAGTSSENFKEVLRLATNGVVQIRDSMGSSDYVAVTSTKEQRYSNDRTDERRFFTLQVVEVDGWAPGLEARGFTLQDIHDYYTAASSLQDIADDYLTLLAIAQGDFST
jgi:hypothetical protein